MKIKKVQTNKNGKIFVTLEVDQDEYTEVVERCRACRICGCTQSDCRQCVEKTGGPCSWVEWDLCSACFEEAKAKKKVAKK